MRIRKKIIAAALTVPALMIGLLFAVESSAATNNSGACIGYCPGGIGPDKDTRYTYVPLSTLNEKPEQSGHYTGDMVYTLGYVDAIGTTPQCDAGGANCPPDSTYAENDGDVHIALGDQNGNYSTVLEADPTGTLRYSALPHVTDNRTAPTTNCIVAWGFYRFDQGEPQSNPYPKVGVSEIHPLVGWHYFSGTYTAPNGTDFTCQGSTLGSGSYSVTHGVSACLAYCSKDYVTGQTGGQYGFSWLTNLNCDPRAYYLANGGLTPPGSGCDYGPRVLTDGYIESAVYSNNSWTLQIDNGPANGNQNPIQAVVSPEEYWSLSYWTGNKGIVVGGTNPTDVCLFGNLRYNYQLNESEIKPLVGFTKKSDAPGAYCPNVNG